MWRNINLEECLTHIRIKENIHDLGPPESRPSITISRMCGSGGRTVASKLAEYLQPHAPYPHRWTVFDRNLIKKVLEDHWMPGRLAEFLPESSKSMLGELLERIHGKKPAASMVVRQTIETIWQLAESGHVILVGRAANVITRRLRNVFHVRLVASPENRIERLEEVYDFDRATAIEYMKAQDHAKRDYLRDYFGENIEDPELYHIVINTDRISYDEAARLIGDAVIQSFKLAHSTKV